MRDILSARAGLYSTTVWINITMAHTDQTEDSYFVSKSQRKRDMDALQDLGKKLTEYPPARLAKVPMSDNLREALVEMHRLSANGARARQLQFIGKLMRSEDVAAIRAGLEVITGHSRADTARLRRLEKLREKLLEDETTLTELGNLFPSADLQRLRQLRRNALKDQAENRPPRAYREIFQLLRDLDGAGVEVDQSDMAESMPGGTIEGHDSEH
jgi:ribosome-associated protein